MLSNASIRAKADGKDWEYWANEENVRTDAQGITPKNFTEEYLLPYIVYDKTNQSGVVYYVYLNDGSYFYTRKGSCLDFIFDINGEKKTNIDGRDKFFFLYCPSSIADVYIGHRHIKPFGLATIKTRDSALEQCKSSGASCSTLLWMDNWEFKDDYPYSI